MGNAKKYFKREFQFSQFNLKHHKSSDFYISSCQRNLATLPLLFVRGFVFLGCLGILIASMVLVGLRWTRFGHWFIYMTHWGILLITLTSGFSFAVSCRAYLKGPIDATFGLPWYVKAYWVLYNVGFTVAIFITMYYYAFLSGLEFEAGEFSIDPVIDVFIHGINSVLMLIILLSSRQPARLLHFIHPLAFGIVYLLFSVIYHFAGGIDPFGNEFIYPTLDWAEPLVAFLSVLLSAAALIIVHFLVVAISVGRNAATRRFKGSSMTISGSLPR